MKPSLERFRKLRAEVLKGPPLGDAMRIIDEMGRLAVHSLSATAPPSFIPAGVIEKEWFAETAQAFSCDPPPVAAVQAMIEIVHEIQYLRWSQPPKSEFDALTGMHLEMTYQDTAAARKATDTLVRVLPRMIEFTQFLEEGPPIATTIDPRIAATMDQLIEENAKGRHEDPRSEEEPSIGNLLEQLLSAAKALQHRWGGPAPTRGRRPGSWTKTARLLALPIGEAWEQAGVQTSYQSSTGPLLAVLSKAVRAIDGENVQTETIAAALRRHPPLRGWKLQK